MIRTAAMYPAVPRTDAQVSALEISPNPFPASHAVAPRVGDRASPGLNNLRSIAQAAFTLNVARGGDQAIISNCRQGHRSDESLAPELAYDDRQQKPLTARSSRDIR
jgi:hypothetical protein